MDGFTRTLGGIEGGRVLDVATGGGGFVAALAEHLASFDSITGVDTIEKAIKAANEKNEDRRIEFTVGDAANLEFADGAFDTVAIANSLHHMERLDSVFHEMLRVLRPGGKLIVFEMYRDGQNEPQQTHVDLHHWWAVIDTARGVYHRETYTREELVRMLAALPVAELEVADYADTDADPLAEETLAHIEKAIDHYIERAKEAEGQDVDDLVARGEDLRDRARRVGFLGATHIVAVATK